MKKAISLILAVGLTAAALIAATGYAASKVGAAAPQLQTALAAQVAAAQNQVSANSTSADACGNITPHDIASLTNCLTWVRDNFKIPEIWQALWDAGIRVCVQTPGQPQKPPEPPVINPTPPCPSCANGQPGGDAH